MLKMRFKRGGRKRLPFYRLVVMPSTTRQNGRPIKELGYYNPITKDIKLDVDQIVFYLKCGVQPTETVRNLLIRSKILEKS